MPGKIKGTNKRTKDLVYMLKQSHHKLVYHDIYLNHIQNVNNL